MIYHFKVHKERGGGYWAECLELKGCHTQADSREDLRRNMQEALDLYLSEPDDSNLVFPLPRKVAQRKNIVPVQATVRVAFASLLRRERKANGLTQKQVAQKMGFKNVFAYQKLEAPRSANPELETLEKVKLALPDFPFPILFGK